MGQPQDTLLALPAYYTACSLNVVAERADAASPRLTQAEGLAGHLAPDMAAQWKPSVEGFYGRLNKATMVAMVQEAKAPLCIRLADVKKRRRRASCHGGHGANKLVSINYPW
jgi:ParB family chromosome partitioning protein